MCKESIITKAIAYMAALFQDLANKMLPDDKSFGRAIGKAKVDTSHNLFGSREVADESEKTICEKARKSWLRNVQRADNCEVDKSLKS